MIVGKKRWDRVVSHIETMNHELGSVLKQLEESNTEIAKIKTDIAWLKRGLLWVIFAVGAMLFGIVGDYIHRILF